MPYTVNAYSDGSSSGPLPFMISSAAPVAAISMGKIRCFRLLSGVSTASKSRVSNGTSVNRVPVLTAEV
ncbi:hypothetical protein D9M71_808680 [compost metagenome]